MKKWGGSWLHPCIGWTAFCGENCWTLEGLLGSIETTAQRKPDHNGLIRPRTSTIHNAPQILPLLYHNTTLAAGALSLPSIRNVASPLVLPRSRIPSIHCGCCMLHLIRPSPITQSVGARGRLFDHNQSLYPRLISHAALPVRKLEHKTVRPAYSTSLRNLVEKWSLRFSLRLSHLS